MATRGGQIKAFSATRSASTFYGEPAVFVRVKTIGVGSVRGGRVIPSAFGVILPQSLARQLRDSLNHALDEPNDHDDVLILPGEDDV